MANYGGIPRVSLDPSIANRSTENRKVTGSTPVGATRTLPRNGGGFFVFTGASEIEKIGLGVAIRVANGRPCLVAASCGV